MAHNASAPGKIILSGEYAVVFGYPGIAVPAPIGMRVAFEPSQQGKMLLDWKDAPQKWLENLGAIAERCGELGAQKGKLSVVNQLPLRKGMGSSTALVIAVTRALLGQDCRAQALAVEDAVNPGNSGLDFAVIWEGKPVLFRKNTEPQPMNLPANLLENAMLIDTGTPNEATPELIAWVRGREQELLPHLETIGECTERLAIGENLQNVLRKHHRAQVALGVVPEAVQELIAEIERAGGAGKVLGAGARTGGGGIVLALGKKEELISIATSMEYSIPS